MEYSIQILDESKGELIPSESLETITDPNFKNFVTEIINFLTGKIGSGKLCHESSAHHPLEAVLFFVYRPLIASGKDPVSLSADVTALKSEAVCRLDSPWAELTISRSPKPVLRAVFRWNERQILLDQALLAGASTVHPAVVDPIEASVFEEYAADYTNAVLLARSPEARSQAQIDIAERIPADILWLFRHAWQSTKAPFSKAAKHDLGLVLERAAAPYVLLAESLVNKCFESSGATEKYRTILEMNGIFNIYDYKINNIH